LRDINISIQNVDADLAWRYTFALAQKLQVQVAVEFEWRLKPGAAQPGERGALSWG
jgi:hypothetical protein